MDVGTSIGLTAMAVIPVVVLFLWALWVEINEPRRYIPTQRARAVCIVVALLISPIALSWLLGTQGLGNVLDEVAAIRQDTPLVGWFWIVMLGTELLMPLFGIYVIWRVAREPLYVAKKNRDGTYTTTASLRSDGPERRVRPIIHIGYDGLEYQSFRPVDR
jgi:hypothetical protein